jgi:hypothetical protein
LKNMKRLSVFFGLVLAAGLASTSNAGFVNGDFETGDFTGWDIYLTPNGATAVQDVVLFDLGYGESYVGRFSVGEATYDGTQQGVIISQTLWLMGGFAYDLGCHAGAWRQYGGTNSEGGVFTLFVEGSTVDFHAVGSITGGQPPKLFSLDGQYTPAADGYYEVGVKITRPYTVPSDLIYQMVDDFYITPAPGALALLGLAGLIGRRRR